MQPDKIDKIETMIYHENLQETDHAIVHPGNDHLFDLSGLEEMDDNEYLVEIVTIFLNETPGELREIREALAAGKTELIFKKAHKLKSSAGVLQAGRLRLMLAEIETIAKSGKINDELIRLVANAHREHKKIEYGLKKHLQTLKS